MRNVAKQAEIGRSAIGRGGRRDLSLGEVDQIFEIYKEKLKTTGSHTDGLWEAIGTAYYMGYAVGARAATDK